MTAVDQQSTDHNAVSTEKLGGGVLNDIGTEFKRFYEIRRRER